MTGMFSIELMDLSTDVGQKSINRFKGKLFYCQKAIKKVLFCQKIVRFDAYFLTEKIPSKKGVQTCANLTFADCTFADGHLLPRHSD